LLRKISFKYEKSQNALMVFKHFNHSKTPCLEDANREVYVSSGLLQPTEPFLGALRDSKLEKVVSKTLEYDLMFPLRIGKIKDRLGGFLEKHLKDFDSSEAGRIGDEHAFFKDPRPIKESLKKLHLLTAYEEFWSNWNPVAALPSKEVYKALGGKDKPVRATMGAFFYSGLVVHALNPLMVPMYAYAAITNNLNLSFMPIVIGTVTAAYVAMGVPVAISKHLRQEKEKKEQKQS
jgi:hypothetical protein